MNISWYNSIPVLKNCIHNTVFYSVTNQKPIYFSKVYFVMKDISSKYLQSFYLPVDIQAIPFELSVLIRTSRVDESDGQSFIFFELPRLVNICWLRKYQKWRPQLRPYELANTIHVSFGFSSEVVSLSYVWVKCLTVHCHGIEKKILLR